MIKAIIFDCFGVLTSDAWLPFKNQRFGDNPDKFEEAGRLNALCDSGKIGYDQFVQMIGDLAGITGAEVDRIISANVPNEPLFDFIASELHGHYQIGLLSNAGSDWLAELFQPDQLAMFSALTLSCDIGFVKPAPEAYQAAMSALGMDYPAECLFIDDQLRFIEGAEKIGMKTVAFNSTEQAIADINQALQADSDS